jgi:hypothetical protein
MLENIHFYQYSVGDFKLTQLLFNYSNTDYSWIVEYMAEYTGFV